MTATTATAAAAAAGNGGTGARLAYLPGDNQGNMGMLLRANRAVRQYTDRARRSLASAWAWLVRTTHLDTAWSYVKAGISWAGDKIATAARFLGGSGMTGAGLLAIATDTGRKIIGGVLRPVGWLLGMIGRGYVAVENMLFSEKREGGVRNWISNRMADARIWAFGDDTKTGPVGIIPSAALWLIKNVGPYLHLDSLTMRLARSAGTLMLAPRAMDLIALLPVGGFYWPLRMIASVLIGYAVWVPVSGTLTSLYHRVANVVSNDVEAADKTVSKTATVIKGEVAEARTKEEAAHAAAQTTTTAAATPRGRNRAERRAGDRAGARA